MIKILNGNLFDTNAQLICHQVNCQGVMGSGVALEVKNRYPKVYRDYRKIYERGGLSLGHVVFSETYNPKQQIIANLCGQDKYGRDKQYTNYVALKQCLQRVHAFINGWYGDQKIKIAFPYGMSSVRGGGDWNVVYKIIEEELGEYEVEIWKL